MTNKEFQSAVVKQLAQQALEIGTLKHLLLKKNITPAELNRAEQDAMSNLDTVQAALKKAMGLL